MQSIAYMVALSCFAVLTIFSIGLLVLGKLNQYVFLAMLVCTILVSVAIAWGARKMWFRLSPASIEGGVDTAIAEVNEFTQEKLAEIERDVNLHKASITALLKEANESSKSLSQHEMSINNLITKAEQVESKLQETIELARPPILKLQSDKSKKRGDGIGKVFRLFPDKNVALGIVAILAIIDSNTNSKILRMEHAGQGIAHHASTKITHEGKRALKIFYTPVPTPLHLEIVVSEPCDIRIESTYPIRPDIINVEHPTE